MVTKDTLIQSTIKLVDWNKKNKNPTITQGIKRTTEYLKDAFEIKVNQGTLLSLVCPIPESKVNQINRLKMKRRYRK